MPNVFGPKKPLFGPYTYRVKQNSNGDTLLAVYHGSKRIAHMDAYWAYSVRTFEEREADVQRYGKGRACYTDLRTLGAEGKYPNILSVSHAFIDDPAYMGKGIGRAMYEAMMAEGYAVRETRIGGSPGPLFFVPDVCEGVGSTSADALRVWASLGRDYPSAGVVIRVDAPPVVGSRAKVNPHRRRNSATYPRVVVALDQHLPQATARVEAGFYFEEGGCIGMALALQDTLRRYGVTAPLALFPGFKHAGVLVGKRFLDASGLGLQDVAAAPVTRHRLLEVAEEWGNTAEGVLSDQEYAQQAIDIALEEEPVANPRRRNPDPSWTVKDTDTFLRAAEKMRPAAQRWAYRAAQENKEALLDAYEALTDAERAALAKAVRETWEDAGYVGRRLLYRTPGRYEEAGYRGAGGLSLSHKPTSGRAYYTPDANVRVFEVSPDEVVLDSTVPPYNRLWLDRFDAWDPPRYDTRGRPTNLRSQMTNEEARALVRSPLWSDQYGAEDEVILKRSARPPETAYTPNPRRLRGRR